MKLAAQEFARERAGIAPPLQLRKLRYPRDRQISREFRHKAVRTRRPLRRFEPPFPLDFVPPVAVAPKHPRLVKIVDFLSERPNGAAIGLLGNHVFALGDLCARFLLGGRRRFLPALDSFASGFHGTSQWRNGRHKQCEQRPAIAIHVPLITRYCTAGIVLIPPAPSCRDAR